MSKIYNTTRRAGITAQKQHVRARFGKGAVEDCFSLFTGMPEVEIGTPSNALLVAQRHVDLHCGSSALLLSLHPEEAL